MPTAAQPAPSPPATAAGRNVAVIDRSLGGMDAVLEVVAAAAIAGAGGAGVNVDASMSILRYKILPAS
jgi:hypothetical protein